MRSASPWDKEFAEIRVASDPGSVAFSHENPAVPGFSGVVRRGEPFPGVAFERVRVFTTNFVKERPFPWQHATAFTEDGRYTPSVNLPGKLLDAEATRLLLEATPLRDPAPRFSTGWPHFHHVYVFYDANERPVAELVVGSRSGWSLTAELLPREARPLLNEVCERSGVGMCWVASERAERIWKAWYDSHGVEDEPYDRLRFQPPGVDTSTFQSETTPLQRRELCAWNSLYAAGRFLIEWRGYSFLGDWRPELPRFPDGYGYFFRIMGWEECVERFGECQVPLDAMLPCQAHAQRGDAFFNRRDAPEECQSLRHCVWGFETRVGKPPPDP